MSTDAKLPPPGFFHVFKPAEQVIEDDYSKFHPYLEPLKDEAPHAYAKRLGKHGLAVPIGVDDARDFPTYKRLLAEAEARKLPIAAMTGELPDHFQDAQPTGPLATEEQRSAYITEARKTAAPFLR